LSLRGLPVTLLGWCSAERTGPRRVPRVPRSHRTHGPLPDECKTDRACGNPGTRKPPRRRATNFGAESETKSAQGQVRSVTLRPFSVAQRIAFHTAWTRRTLSRPSYQTNVRAAHMPTSDSHAGRYSGKL